MVKVEVTQADRDASYAFVNFDGELCGSGHEQDRLRSCVAELEAEVTRLKLAVKWARIEGWLIGNEERLDHHPTCDIYPGGIGHCTCGHSIDVMKAEKEVVTALKGTDDAN